MPYVRRDPEGRIDSLYREAVPDVDEYLPEDHPEVRAFLRADSARQQQFATLDADLVRVLEDLVDVLIAKNVIRITDLPLEAQQKLFNRKHFRDRMQKNSLKLFDEETGFGGSDVIQTDFGTL